MRDLESSGLSVVSTRQAEYGVKAGNQGCEQA